MSVDVGTRWYKAPDILYGARKYDSSVDIWSAGCILAELLDTTPLFTGFNDLDQTAKIAYFIGVPDPDIDKSFFDRLPDNHYQIKTELKKTSDVSLKSHFKSHPPEVVDLLERMLKYSARPTASECLADNWFHEISFR